MHRWTPGRWAALLALPALLWAAPCFAAPNDLEEIVLWTDEALGSGASLTSQALSTYSFDPDQLLLKVTSAAGTADVKIEYEVAQDKAGTFGTTAANDPISSSTATAYAGAAPEELHSYALPSALTFRIVLTELAGNSDTVVNATAVFRKR